MSCQLQQGMMQVFQRIRRHIAKRAPGRGLPEKGKPRFWKNCRFCGSPAAGRTFSRQGALREIFRQTLLPLRQFAHVHPLAAGALLQFFAGEFYGAAGAARGRIDKIKALEGFI